jgi:hypothetical protein
MVGMLKTPKYVPLPKSRPPCNVCSQLEECFRLVRLRPFMSYTKRHISNTEMLDFRSAKFKPYPPSASKPFLRMETVETPKRLFKVGNKEVKTVYGYLSHPS